MYTDGVFVGVNERRSIAVLEGRFGRKSAVDFAGIDRERLGNIKSVPEVTSYLGVFNDRFAIIIIFGLLNNVFKAVFRSRFERAVIDNELLCGVVDSDDFSTCALERNRAVFESSFLSVYRETVDEIDVGESKFVISRVDDCTIEFSSAAYDSNVTLKHDVNVRYVAREFDILISVGKSWFKFCCAVDLRQVGINGIRDVDISSADRKSHSFLSGSSRIEAGNLESAVSTGNIGNFTVLIGSSEGDLAEIELFILFKYRLNIADDFDRLIFQKECAGAECKN